MTGGGKFRMTKRVIQSDQGVATSKEILYLGFDVFNLHNLKTTASQVSWDSHDFSLAAVHVPTLK